MCNVRFYRPEGSGQKPNTQEARAGGKYGLTVTSREIIFTWETDWPMQ